MLSEFYGNLSNGILIEIWIIDVTGIPCTFFFWRGPVEDSTCSIMLDVKCASLECLAHNTLDRSTWF